MSINSQPAGDERYSMEFNMPLMTTELAMFNENDAAIVLWRVFWFYQ